MNSLLVTENITFFACTAIIIAILVIMIFANKKHILSQAALYAVSKAEAYWGSDTGKIKFAEVYSFICKQHPFISAFLSEQQLSDIIENALSLMKRTLENKIIKENKELAKQLETANVSLLAEEE